MKEKLGQYIQSLKQNIQAGLVALRNRKVVSPSLPKLNIDAFKNPAFRIKYLTGLVALVVMIATAAGVQAHVRSFTYVVYLDGEEIGFVSNETVIYEHAAELQAAEEERYGLEVKPVQELVVAKEQRKGEEPSDWEVKDELRRRMLYDVYAYVIMVNDTATLAVRTIDDYEYVINDLKGAYINGQDNAVIQAVVLNDKVEARRTLVDPDALYSADKAVEILRRGTDRREVYLVSRGDSLWTIARQNSMTVTEIQQANPHLAGTDKIKPGEEISLVVSEPLVDVSVTQDVVLQQRIPYTTKYQNDSKMYKGKTKILEPGEYGVKEITVRITQENGSEVQREILSETVVKEPVGAVVARGTAPVPIPQGTGRFMWPVAGGGKITSRYGPRGRSFHRGVDIASGKGTGILASDSGVVTQAGWSGGYGIMVTVDHGNGFMTRYAHNSSVLVSVGQRVKKGQQIARMGSTGNSTGPHLHFEVIRNGYHINPMNYF
jgi:murein DD-endopeptidase MepM/ murein hydrolase activator NlpD